MNPNFTIEEIKGQENALVYANYYKKLPGHLPPLLIFHGPDGTGKWSLAERLAYSVLCLQETGCGQCESCKLFFLNQHPDYIVFPVDSRIAIGEEKDPDEFTVRWLLSRRILYKPHTSNRRIVLLPDASLLGNEAETALLKTLEEPPHHTRFIFIVDDLHKLKQTVVSRGVSVPFGYLSQNILKKIAEEKQIYREDFFGGSLAPTRVPTAVIELTLAQTEKGLTNPLGLLEFENWVRHFKDNPGEWKEDFNYNEFLELVCLCLIFQFSKPDKHNIKILDFLFTFKETLHRQIPNLENFLLSQLFHKISMTIEKK
jgi:DNA polymerase III subunit gamma/tau